MKIRHLSSLHKISAMNSHVWSVLFDVYMTEIVLAKHRLFSDHNLCVELLVSVLRVEGGMLRRLILIVNLMASRNTME